jgi:hypothetical protein
MTKPTVFLRHGIESVYNNKKDVETAMKKTGRKFWVVFLGFALATLFIFQASAASAAEQQNEGFLGDYYKNLAAGPEGGAKMRWLKPGTDFAKYNKVMLDSVIFYFPKDEGNKGMDPQEMKELADGFNLAIINALKETYPIVAEPGPDVIRLRFAITDIKRSKPGMSAISSVVPIGLGISLVKKGATGGWTGSGATSAEMMALDSTTGDVVAVAQDDRSAKFSERFSKWGSAEEAFKFWGERVKKFLDGTRSAK